MQHGSKEGASTVSFVLHWRMPIVSCSPSCISGPSDRGGDDENQGNGSQSL